MKKLLFLISVVTAMMPGIAAAIDCKSFSDKIECVSINTTQNILNGIYCYWDDYDGECKTHGDCYAEGIFADEQTCTNTSGCFWSATEGPKDSEGIPLLYYDVCYPIHPLAPVEDCDSKKSQRACERLEYCEWLSARTKCIVKTNAYHPANYTWDDHANTTNTGSDTCADMPGFARHTPPDGGSAICAPCPSGAFCPQIKPLPDGTANHLLTPIQCPSDRPNSKPYSTDVSECFALNYGKTDTRDPCVSESEGCLGKCSAIKTKTACAGAYGCYWKSKTKDNYGKEDDIYTYAMIDNYHSTSTNLYAVQSAVAYCAAVDNGYYSGIGDENQTSCGADTSTPPHASSAAQCSNNVVSTRSCQTVDTGECNCEALCTPYVSGVKSCTMHLDSDGKVDYCTYDETSCPDGLVFKADTNQCVTCQERDGDNYYWDSETRKCESCSIPPYQGTVSADGSCTFTCNPGLIDHAVTTKLGYNGTVEIAWCDHGAEGLVKDLVVRNCNATRCDPGYGTTNTYKTVCEGSTNINSDHIGCEYCASKRGAEYFNPNGIGQCRECIKGTSANDGKACKCLTGFYKNPNSATGANCDKCPAGYACEGTITDGKSACNNGFYQDTEMQDYCKKCSEWPAGDSDVPTDKAYCPDTGGVGLTKPKKCEDWQKPNDARTGCESCTWNKSECPAGKSKCGAGTEAACTANPVGYYPECTNGTCRLNKCPGFSTTTQTLDKSNKPEFGAKDKNDCFIGGGNMTFVDSNGSFLLPQIFYMDIK